MPNTENKHRVADAIVEFLASKKITKAFGVPGESYLDVLDAMIDYPHIEFVTCRQEGGASIMAEAYGKLHNKPGVCMVTRGPGATNGSAGVHIAKQDSTPMLFFIGQVGTDMLGREAFQEIDYKQMFGTVAKAVIQIDNPQRINEHLEYAYSIATTGRQGPVVIALPEDVLSAMVSVRKAKPTTEQITSVSMQSLQTISEKLLTAERPLIIAGGGTWSQQTTDLLLKFSEQHNVAVASSFRRQDYFPNQHKNYIGHLGLGVDSQLVNYVKSADLIIVLGCRLSEITTQSYTLFFENNADKDIKTQIGAYLVHVHPDAMVFNNTLSSDVTIATSPMAFMQQLAESINSSASNKFATENLVRESNVNKAHQHYLDFITAVDNYGDISMAFVIQQLNKTLPKDAFIANGAGNYAAWLHRFYQYQNYGTQLAPTSGSMGYGLPAAIAATLSNPGRKAVCLAGDGCLMMTVQEIATAVMYDADLLIIVINNSQYGTIRMHQQMHYPSRTSGTMLKNPDFVALAKAFGAEATKVTNDAEYANALDTFVNKKGVALIEVILDQKVISVRDNGLS